MAFKPLATIPVDGRNFRWPYTPISITGHGTFGIVALEERRQSDGIPVMNYMAIHPESGVIFDADSNDPDECLKKLNEILSLRDRADLEKTYAENIALIKKNDEGDLAYRKTLDYSGKGLVRKGAVYLIKAAGRYKLGQSLNPLQRIGGMTLPEKPEVLVVHYTAKYRDAERELHMRFAHRRGHGEWFDFEPHEIEEVEKAIRAF